MLRRALPWLATIACACTRAGESTPEDHAAAIASTAAAVVTRGIDRDLRETRLSNPTAYIPAQCYVRTRGDDGRVHNPCAACHHAATAPNYIDDAELQLAYDFAAPARVNRWTNLEVDRTAAIAAAGTDDVLAWVREGNYFDADGDIALASTLAEVPAGWDADGDGSWSGYVPDCWFAFDAHGFDHDPTGAPTGWRAYVAPPFPGFWPSNGSAGDTMIRLPAAYREDASGRDDPSIYAVNLAIAEALMTRRDVVIAPVDERALAVDLDRDGALDIAEAVTFHWAPRRGEGMQWVGRARALQASGEAPLAAGLLPVGTELLHSVRYLDLAADGRVTMAARMKELRYARKRSWRSYGELEQAVAGETKEKHDHPDRLRRVHGDVEHGVLNGQGWVYQGFIEDEGGTLRPQTFEESVACVGCHSGTGATSDGVFSLPRKLAGARPDDGWHHAWRPGDAAGPEPRRRDGTGEYAHWLANNLAADDWRADTELAARFFDAAGALRPEALRALSQDIASLVLPSPARALALDAAYREIVRAQSFVAGRDVAAAPVTTMWRELPQDEATGVQTPVGPR